MKKFPLLIFVSFLAGALFFALTFGFLQKSPQEQKIEVAPAVATAQSSPVKPQSSTDFVPLVKKVKPAVVIVYSESIQERSSFFDFGDDFFNFFDVPRRRERVRGQGSGFFISADGYVLTNNHVVENAVKVKVVNFEEKEFTAKIIGTDPKTDLALIKININNAPFLELGDSNKVEVGEWVLAIGNPLGQELTVTSGIISAKGRQLGVAQYEDFIQTDAAINVGNSGGPLVNMRGEAIGINSVILSPNQGNIGLGFAIPANMAKKVVNDLKQKGKVVRGYLGIQIQGISASEAKDLDLPQGGVLIASVEKGSPAENSGLKRYDLIVRINNKDVKTPADLLSEIANTAPGDYVEITYYRNKNKNVVKIKVAEAPENVSISSRESERIIDLGMIVQNNNQQLVKEFNLKTNKGIVITSISRNGAAARNGLRIGDVILAVNRTEVNSVSQFRKLLEDKNEESNIFLLINRNGNEMFLKFRLDETD